MTMSSETQLNFNRTATGKIFINKIAEVQSSIRQLSSLTTSKNKSKKDQTNKQKANDTVNIALVRCFSDPNFLKPEEIHRIQQSDAHHRVHPSVDKLRKIMFLSGADMTCLSKNSKFEGCQDCQTNMLTRKGGNLKLLTRVLFAPKFSMKYTSQVF